MVAAVKKKNKKKKQKTKIKPNRQQPQAEGILDMNQKKKKWVHHDKFLFKKK